MNLIQTLEAEQMKHLRKKAHPEFRPGDTLKVNVKVVEEARAHARLQAFEGVCIAAPARDQRELHRAQDLLRRRRGARVPDLLAAGGHVAVVRKGRVRRAKLYYLRGRRGKSARIGEKTERATAVNE